MKLDKEETGQEAGLGERSLQERCLHPGAGAKNHVELFSWMMCPLRRMSDWL